MPRVSKEQLIKQLMENNVSLQDKTTELVESIRVLAEKLDHMVSLFEEAAEHIKEGTDQPLMRKLDSLLEQNKAIASGLILLERYIREKASTSGTNISGFPPKDFKPGI